MGRADRGVRLLVFGVVLINAWIVAPVVVGATLIVLECCVKALTLVFLACGVTLQDVLVLLTP